MPAKYIIEAREKFEMYDKVNIKLTFWLIYYSISLEVNEDESYIKCISRDINKYRQQNYVFRTYFLYKPKYNYVHTFSFRRIIMGR